MDPPASFWARAYGFTLAKHMAEVSVVPVSIHAQNAKVGFPSDLLRAICQFIFVDGPQASNSSRAAQELVAALVKCVERVVKSIGKDQVDSSSCLASMMAFVADQGLSTERDRHAHVLGRKSVPAMNYRSTATANTDNENYRNY